MNEVRSIDWERDEEKKRKFEQAKIDFADKIEMWFKDHPEHVPPPIWYDEATKTFNWASRVQRRRWSGKG